MPLSVDERARLEKLVVEYENQMHNGLGWPTSFRPASRFDALLVILAMKIALQERHE